jgi:hypothetical protein
MVYKIGILYYSSGCAFALKKDGLSSPIADARRTNGKRGEKRKLHIDVSPPRRYKMPAQKRSG